MKKEFGFVLAAAILLAGCGQKKETTTTTARPVKTTIVESRSIIRKDFSGIVRFKSAGKLTSGKSVFSMATWARRLSFFSKTTTKSSLA